MMAYCAPCGRSFVHRGALAQHVDYSDIHQVNCARYCRTCNRLYSDASDLREHRSRVHGAYQTYCRPCGRCFVDNAALQNHLQFSSAHAPSEPYCRTCDRYFVDDVALQQHLDCSTAHLDDSDDSDESDDYDEPYCTTCDRYFANDCDLEQHLDTSSAHNVFRAPSADRIPPRSSKPTLFSGNPTSSVPQPARIPPRSSAPAPSSGNPTSIVPQPASSSVSSRISPVVSKKENVQTRPNTLKSPDRPQPIPTSNKPPKSLDPNVLGNREDPTAETMKGKEKENITNGIENPNASEFAQSSGIDKTWTVPLAEAIAKCLEREFPHLRDLDGSMVAKALVKDPDESSSLAASKPANNKITPAESSGVLKTESPPASTRSPTTGQEIQKASICPTFDHKAASPTTSVLEIQESLGQDLLCCSCNLPFKTEEALSDHIRDTPDHHICLLCSQVTQFATVKLLEKHQVSSHGLCTLCNELFGNSHTLFEHDILDHNLCKACKNYFMTKDDLHKVINPTSNWLILNGDGLWLTLPQAYRRVSPKPEMCRLQRIL